MNYRLKMTDGTNLPWTSSKVVCVGQNYAAHIEEMGSKRVKDPVIFMKPATALCKLTKPITLPAFSNDVHHEIELAVIIGQQATNLSEVDAEACIEAYALAIDLTARDLQQQFKENGHPWELAKAFDGSCPISPCMPKHEIEDPQNIELSLSVNAELRQSGNTKMMIHPITKLIAFISQHVTLLPGDIVLTGTPAGVGPLVSGDMIACECAGKISLQTAVI